MAVTGRQLLKALRNGAPPDEPVPRQAVLAALAGNRTDRERLAFLEAEKLELWKLGRLCEPPVSMDELGEVAGVTGTAVSIALHKAKLKGDLTVPPRRRAVS